jgi:hypothetical protein
VVPEATGRRFVGGAGAIGGVLVAFIVTTADLYSTPLITALTCTV